MYCPILPPSQSSRTHGFRQAQWRGGIFYFSCSGARYTVTNLLAQCFALTAADSYMCDSPPAFSRQSVPCVARWIGWILVCPAAHYVWPFRWRCYYNNDSRSSIKPARSVAIARAPVQTRVRRPRVPFVGCEKRAQSEASREAGCNASPTD